MRPALWNQREKPAYCFDPAVVVAGAAMIFLKATMKRSISSGTPTETRRCCVIGGNGRPTSDTFVAERLITGCTSRRRPTMKKFVCDGMTS